MTALWDYLQDGGPLMVVLTVLGLLQSLLICGLIWCLRRGFLQRAADLMAPLRAVVAMLPLLGLLGTVGGMVTCLSALAGQPLVAAGDSVNDAMGAGISQALYSTHYALAMAIPGLLAERLLSASLRQRQVLADGDGERSALDAPAWQEALP